MENEVHIPNSHILNIITPFFQQEPDCIKLIRSTTESRKNHIEVQICIENIEFPNERLDPNERKHQHLTIQQVQLAITSR